MIKKIGLKALKIELGEATQGLKSPNQPAKKK